MLPEGLEELLVAHPCRVIRDQHRLGVAGLAGAGLSIGRVRGHTTGITDSGRDDARQLPEVLLGTPETAEAEDGRSGAVRPRAGERRAEDGVATRCHDG